MTASVPNSIVVHRSRFEVDLNRPRNSAVYRTADEAWGLDIWNQPADQSFVDRSLRLHDSFYATMKTVLQQMVEAYGHFVLLDIHSYNHRRNGPDSDATPQEQAPEVNIGTHSMPVGRWNSVLAATTDTIRSFDYRGRSLDVRYNVAFQGKGELTRFVHKHFADTGCALAIEFKKFYMDEWTGVPFSHDIAALQKLIAALVPVLTTVSGACAKSGDGGSGVHSTR